jgi:hypothetical protein
MKKHIINVLLLCFLFFESCSKKETITDDIYIIKSKVKTPVKEYYNSKNEKLSLPPPPPSPEFYGLANIVIDKQGEFYFYQREHLIAWNCFPEENPNPDFIDLKPIELIKVPKNSIVDFLKENTSPDIKKNYGSFVIASQLDTLKTKEFINLMRFINNTKKSQIRMYLIRKTTQEENIVLRFKKNDSVYFSNQVKWHKDSIKFVDDVKFLDKD